MTSAALVVPFVIRYIHLNVHTYIVFLMVVLNDLVVLFVIRYIHLNVHTYIVFLMVVLNDLASQNRAPIKCTYTQRNNISTFNVNKKIKGWVRSALW
jgi:hypothetical protein